jgi:hypothetical protein
MPTIQVLRLQIEICWQTGVVLQKKKRFLKDDAKKYTVYSQQPSWPARMVVLVSQHAACWLGGQSTDSAVEMIEVRA